MRKKVRKSFKQLLIENKQSLLNNKENMKEIEFDKAKERVTLTLNDCILLGVETD